eukprot:m.63160 g.63160  ORF g.63160 m.63160 type:complete len:69 (-) comp11427_c1_seq2:1381-1587(-)
MCFQFSHVNSFTSFKDFMNCSKYAEPATKKMPGSPSGVSIVIVFVVLSSTWVVVFVQTSIHVPLGRTT